MKVIDSHLTTAGRARADSERRLSLCIERGEFIFHATDDDDESNLNCIQ